MSQFPDRIFLSAEAVLPELREIISETEELNVLKDVTELEYASDHYLDCIICQLLDKNEALMNLVDYKQELIEMEKRHGNDATKFAALIAELGQQWFQILTDAKLYTELGKLPYHYSLRQGSDLIVLERDDYVLG